MFIHVLWVRGNDFTALFEKLKDGASNLEGALGMAVFSKLLEETLRCRMIKITRVGIEPADRHVNELLRVLSWQCGNDLKSLPSYFRVLRSATF